MKGKIKWYNDEKGYGFIVSDKGGEIFFHRSGIDPSFQPFDGASVQYEEAEGRKGTKAINVRGLEA